MRVRRFAAMATLIIPAFSAAKCYAADIAYDLEPIDYVRVCDAYGGGFYFIPGTDTCLKISGYVRFAVQSDSTEPDASGNGTTSRLPGFVTQSDDPASGTDEETDLRTQSKGRGYISIRRSFGGPPADTPNDDEHGLTNEARRIMQMFQSGELDTSRDLPHVQPRQEQSREPKLDGPTRAVTDSDGNAEVSLNTEPWRNYFQSQYIPLYDGGMWSEDSKIIMTFNVRDYGGGIIQVADQFGHDNPTRSVLFDTQLPAGAEMSARLFTVGDVDWIRTTWAVSPSIRFDVGDSLEWKYGINYSYDWGGRAQPAGEGAAGRITALGEPLPHGVLRLSPVGLSGPAQ